MQAARPSLKTHLHAMKSRLQPRSLRGDIFGGLTTAIISLPMALTFGITSGAGAAAGLYGAILVGLGAALFGSSKTLISEPTGPMTVIMTAVVMGLVQAHGVELGLGMAFCVVVVAGLTQIIFGLLRLGKYVTLMPYSVISGFMSGIGILMILMQVPALLGQSAPAGGAMGVLRGLPELLGHLQWQELALGVGALLLLFAVPKRWQRWMPPQLLVLIVGTLAAVTILGPWGIARIGAIPSGLPAFQMPSFTAAQSTQILLDGVVLGMLGCIDALITAMIADSLTRDHHDSNRELIGQGVGNMLSGFFGGLPGAGATMGTVVNIQTGGNSALSGLIRVAILLSVVLVVGPVLAVVPTVVLAAIAFKVGFDILDWSFLRRAPGISRTATGIMWAVLILTVTVDLVVAVGVGVFIANIMTIERLSKLAESRIRTFSTSGDCPQLPAAEEAMLKQADGRIVLLQLSGPIIFGVARAIARKTDALADADILIIDLSDVPMLNTTIALALENVVREAAADSHPVFISGADGDVAERLRKVGLLDSPLTHACASRQDAIEKALAALKPIPAPSPDMDPAVPPMIPAGH